MGDVSNGETGVQITNYSTIVTAEVQIRVNGHVGVSGGKSEEWHLTRDRNFRKFANEERKIFKQRKHE